MSLAQNPAVGFSGLKGEEDKANLRSRDDQLVLINLFLKYWKKEEAAWTFKRLNLFNYPSVLLSIIFVSEEPLLLTPLPYNLVSY